MKTTRTIAVILLAGFATFTFQPASAATGHATWAMLTNQVGQFFGSRQPKQDPFSDASSDVDRLRNEKKADAVEHLRRGREALLQGNVQAATYFLNYAAGIDVSYGPDEDTPARLAEAIKKSAAQPTAPIGTPRRLPAAPSTARVINGSNGAAPNAYPSTGPRYANFQQQPGSYPSNQVQQAIFNPQQDSTQNRQVAGSPGQNPPSNIEFTGQQRPAPPRQARPLPAAPAQRASSLPAGVPAPPVPDLPAYRRAQPSERTNPQVQSVLSPPVNSKRTTTTRPVSQVRPVNPATNRSNVPSNVQVRPSASPEKDRLLTEASQSQQRLVQKLMLEISQQARDALDLRDEDPLGALKLLRETRTTVEKSALDNTQKQSYLNRVDEMLEEMEQHVERHRAEIDLNVHNQQILDDLARKREHKTEVQQRLELLVKEYNTLRNEERFYEAEIKAKEARLLAPDDPVVEQLFQDIRFYRRVVLNSRMRDEKESAVWETLSSAERSAIPYGDDNDPIKYHVDWSSLSASREKYQGDGQRERHPAELEIERKLGTPITMKFTDAPLNEVIDYIKKVAKINVYLDPQGLAAEGVHPSQPVSIELEEISIRSALKLVLAQFSLKYVINNEVLKITSEHLGDRTVFPKTYNVADLVIPIPDFSPHEKHGIQRALDDGYRQTNQTLAGVTGGNIQPTGFDLATTSGQIPDNIYAQGGGGAGGGTGSSTADFDSLITLITTTIEPESWEDVGGPGTVAPFETNLSLVVSQTQEVHEKIADLLRQLRRLQDLQVTIEVRFITLTDNFFEQIGIDFDFNIDDNVNQLPNDDSGRSTVVGLGFADGNPTNQTSTLANPVTNIINGFQDIQVRQGSFASTAPAFGGFTPATATTFGVAILSDIEAYFLVQAAQGDARANIMQSPKVTLFNGQSASIADQVQQPFVSSVTPVVGDFAAAQAPVIVVLAEGTTLSVQAVISQDRRYVRLTLIPFFSEIRDVTEFTFEGSTSSTIDRSDSNQDDGSGATSSSATDNIAGFTQGTTIQLPTFAFTTVTTTVSVPDGGTVLLGGVKRLREQRNEIGTPFLSKLPYVSRLFKNVGVGRETSSIMLMVTPRIIIQEEEESKLGLALPNS